MQRDARRTAKWTGGESGRVTTCANRPMRINELRFFFSSFALFYSLFFYISFSFCFLILLFSWTECSASLSLCLFLSLSIFLTLRLSLSSVRPSATQCPGDVIRRRCEPVARTHIDAMDGFVLCVCVVCSRCVYINIGVPVKCGQQWYVAQEQKSVEATTTIGSSSSISNSSSAKQAAKKHPEKVKRKRNRIQKKNTRQNRPGM